MATEVAGPLREVSKYEEGKSVASTVSPVGFLLGFLLPILCCMPALASPVAIPLRHAFFCQNMDELEHMQRQNCKNVFFYHTWKTSLWRT